MGLGETEVSGLCGRVGGAAAGRTRDVPIPAISCEGLTVERDIVQAPQTSRGSEGSWAGKDSVLGREPGKILILVKPQVLGPSGQVILKAWDSSGPFHS